MASSFLCSFLRSFISDIRFNINNSIWQKLALKKNNLKSPKSCSPSLKFQGLFYLYLVAKIEYYKNMKQNKSLTQTQYAECYAKALTYVAQILAGAFFFAILIFPIF